MNEERKRVAIFPAASILGRDLRDAMQTVVQGQGFEPEFVDAPTVESFFAACLCNAAVIIDASLEEGCEEIYRAVSFLPNVFDHILVVSRTYLPLNFVPSVSGGAPIYPYPNTGFLYV